MKSASQRSNMSLEDQAPADVTESSPAPKPSAYRDKLEEQLGAMNHSRRRRPSSRRPPSRRPSPPLTTPCLRR